MSALSRQLETQINDIDRQMGVAQSRQALLVTELRGYYNAYTSGKRTAESYQYLASMIEPKIAAYQNEISNFGNQIYDLKMRLAAEKTREAVELEYQRQSQAALEAQNQAAASQQSALTQAIESFKTAQAGLVAAPSMASTQASRPQTAAEAARARLSEARAYGESLRLASRIHNDFGLRSEERNRFYGVSGLTGVSDMINNDGGITYSGPGLGSLGIVAAPGEGFSISNIFNIARGFGVTIPLDKDLEGFNARISELNKLALTAKSQNEQIVARLPQGSLLGSYYDAAKASIIRATTMLQKAGATAQTIQAQMNQGEVSAAVTARYLGEKNAAVSQYENAKTSAGNFFAQVQAAIKQASKGPGAAEWGQALVASATDAAKLGLGISQYMPWIVGGVAGLYLLALMPRRR